MSDFRAMESEPDLHDWPGDWSHENGRYMCRCIHCGAPFYGHKRRVVCKACHTLRAQRESSTEVANGTILREMRKCAPDVKEHYDLSVGEGIELLCDEIERLQATIQCLEGRRIPRICAFCQPRKTGVIHSPCPEHAGVA